GAQCGRRSYPGPRGEEAAGPADSLRGRVGMKRAILLPLLLAGIGALAFVAAGGRAPDAPAPPAHAAALHPVVVELFTAQGCSSCPPADAALDRLSQDP